MILAVIQSFAGSTKKDQTVKENELIKFPVNSKYASVDQTHSVNVEERGVLCSNLPSIQEGVPEDLHSASEALLHVKDSVVTKEISNNEVIVTGTPVAKTTKKPILGISCQSELESKDSKLEKRDHFSAGNIPRYVNLEPSLAMDWLEISWDELRIKERVGAGNLSAFPASLY